MFNKNTTNEIIAMYPYKVKEAAKLKEKYKYLLQNEKAIPCTPPPTKKTKSKRKKRFNKLPSPRHHLLSKPSKQPPMHTPTPKKKQKSSILSSNINHKNPGSYLEWCIDCQQESKNDTQTITNQSDELKQSDELNTRKKKKSVLGKTKRLPMTAHRQNPLLMTSVWNNEKFIPKDYEDEFKNTPIHEISKNAWLALSNHCSILYKKCWHHIWDRKLELLECHKYTHFLQQNQYTSNSQVWFILFSFDLFFVYFIFIWFILFSFGLFYFHLVYFLFCLIYFCSFYIIYLV